jgi:hypothetical protein
MERGDRNVVRAWLIQAAASPGHVFCGVMCFFAVVVLISYALWHEKRTIQRWLAISVALASSVAGMFEPTYAAIGSGILAIVLLGFVDTPNIDDEEKVIDDTPSGSENEIIAREYESSLLGGVDEDGHLVNPTPEFKRLALNDKETDR